MTTEAASSIFAAKVEVDGSVVGCLGAGEVAIPPSVTTADQLCEEQAGFPAAETAAAFQAMLEAPYGAGQVEVTGGPPGAAPFEVSTGWGVKPLTLTPLLFAGVLPTGSAASEIVSVGSGRLVVTLANLGDAPVDATSAPLTIEDDLPTGVVAYGARAFVGASGAQDAVDCALPSPGSLTCAFDGRLPSYEVIEIQISVALAGGLPLAASPGKIRVFGANAPSAGAAQRVNVSDDPAPFGIESFSLRAEVAGGAPADQAGSHPFQITASLALNQTAAAMPVELPKELRLRLPPGLLANAARLPRCPQHDFFVETCPAATAIGAAGLTINEVGALGLTRLAVPIYNLEPKLGEPARFGLDAAEVPVPIVASLDAASGAATLSITGISQVSGLLNATITLWGTPADPTHDAARGLDCLRAARGDEGAVCHPLADPHPAALLTLPAACAADPPPALLELAPWSAPGRFSSAAATLSTPRGCGRLPFAPVLHAAPTTGAAHAPSGLDLSLRAPIAGLLNPLGLAPASLGALTLSLPEGLTLNPPLASGLLACSRGDLGRESPGAAPGEGCPEAAKLGIATLATPLFPEPVAGAIYAATPGDNLAGDARYAIYVVFKDRRLGVLLPVPVALRPDSATGRLRATIAGLPPLPLERLSLQFNSGPHAPLRTPACGSHSISYSLAPTGSGDPLAGSESFAANSACNTAFAPSLSAGTASNAAGRSAAFFLDLASPATSPSPATIDVTLPPGLSAALGSVSACREPAVSTGACPLDSRLGYARLALGAGPQPLWIPETGREGSTVYLAGPHRGAPYSLLVVVPAQSGPFDLGTVILRAPIRIDPLTAQARVTLADLPRIFAGVPLQYRRLRLVLDRPGFIRNPTSCEPTWISVTATSGDGESAALSSRFQAADCAALPFRPRVSLRFSRALRRNGHPALRAVLRSGRGQAGISDAVLTLPSGQLLDLHHLRALCARNLSATRCPRASRLGWARLFSPFLDRPLQGPIYLREPRHRLPDLIADLRSGPLRIFLRGHTATPPGRLRIRLRSLPDFPLSKTVIDLAGGRRGILVNNEGLCSGTRRAEVRLTAHNAKRHWIRPRIRLHHSC